MITSNTLSDLLSEIVSNVDSLILLRAKAPIVLVKEVNYSAFPKIDES